MNTIVIYKYMYFQKTTSYVLTLNFFLSSYHHSIFAMMKTTDVSFLNKPCFCEDSFAQIGP